MFFFAAESLAFPPFSPLASERRSLERRLPSDGAGSRCLTPCLTQGDEEVIVFDQSVLNARLLVKVRSRTWLPKVRIGAVHQFIRVKEHFAPV